ncbi:Protein Y52B11A.8 [Aphelenchoides avenae]|nr:Protein Y52B11A.8 [Aphelenchus avenae]
MKRRLLLIVLAVLQSRGDGEFRCGTDKEIKAAAEAFVKACDAQIRIDAANECCRRHDACYSQCLGEDHCDDVFCKSLDAVVDGAPEQCQAAASGLCKTVRQRGGPAYKASCGDN